MASILAAGSSSRAFDKVPGSRRWWDGAATDSDDGDGDGDGDEMNATDLMGVLLVRWHLSRQNCRMSPPLEYRPATT